MRWHRIYQKSGIVVMCVSTGDESIMAEETVSTFYQTYSKDLGDGWRGFSIRRVVPSDQVTDPNLKFVLFYPINDHRLPTPYRTLREAKLGAEPALVQLAGAAE